MLRILGPNGQPLPRPEAPAVRPIRARYDAAVYDSESSRHWANADDYSASAANSPEVRRVLRRRARYERANNSYLDGVALTLADDTIGTGPRLQVKTPSPEVNRRITEAFEEWSCAVHLAAKLRTMRQARTIDGEAFAVLTTNPKLRTDVQLDLRLLEADQFADPYPYPNNPLTVDGIRFDSWGNPVEYTVLRSHPGDMLSWGFPTDYDVVPADLVLHWFLPKRPGQVRGIPDVTAALPLFAQLRRYTLAVLAAAETAADFAAVLQSEMPPDSEDFAVADPFEKLEITKRMMTTLPAGWKMGQFHAEQPTTSYDMFKREILTEIGRCLNMPYNKIAGNSSGYNYSSGRLDHQPYYKAVGVDQYDIEEGTLDRLFEAWVDETRMTSDLIPKRLVKVPHAWFWDGFEHIDPQNEATADQIRLETGTTTRAELYARQGYDWRQKLDEEAEVLEYAREKGLPWAPPDLSTLLPAPAPLPAPRQPSRNGNGAPYAER